jgi:hypothetical protein
VEVLLQVLVGVDQLLDGLLLLIQVDLFHFVGGNDGLEVADLLSQGLLERSLPGLASVLAVLPLEVVVLGLELLYDSLEGLNHHLKLTAVLSFGELHLDVVVCGLSGRGGSAGDLVDLLLVSLDASVDDRGELVRAHLVLLEDLNSLLEPSVLEVVSLLLKLQIQDTLLRCKELILRLCLRGLTILELFLKLFDPELSKEAKLLSLLHIVQGLPVDPVDNGVEVPDLALQLCDLLLEVVLLLGESVDLRLQIDINGLVELRVLVLSVIKLLLELL